MRLIIILCTFIILLSSLLTGCRPEPIPEIDPKVVSGKVEGYTSGKARIDVDPYGRFDLWQLNIEDGFNPIASGELQEDGSFELSLGELPTELSFVDSVDSTVCPGVNLTPTVKGYVVNALPVYIVNSIRAQSPTITPPIGYLTQATSQNTLLDNLLTNDYGSFTFAPSQAAVARIYVDKASTAKGTCTLVGRGNSTTLTVDLNLKKGWNVVTAATNTQSQIFLSTGVDSSKVKWYYVSFQDIETN